MQSCCASGDVKTAQNDCEQSFAIRRLIIITICHCLFIDARSLVIVVVYGGCSGLAIVITMMMMMKHEHWIAMVIKIIGEWCGSVRSC